jgi:FkbM family methyltransferase
MRKALRHLVQHVANYGLIRGIQLVLLKSRRSSKLAKVYSHVLGGDVLVRPGTSDMAIFDQIALQAYLPMDRPLHTVIDLGANIGLTVRYWKAHWPNAKVVAVEPDPDNHAMLLANTQAQSDVHCVHAAVWPVPGRLNLRNSGVASSSIRTEPTEGEGDTEAVTIPQLMDRFSLDRVSLLKVDIESAELELFSAHDLAWLERVDAIAIELHDHWKPGCGDAFFRAMASYNWNYSIHGEMVLCVRRQASAAAD